MSLGGFTPTSSLRSSVAPKAAGEHLLEDARRCAHLTAPSAHLPHTGGRQTLRRCLHLTQSTMSVETESCMKAGRLGSIPSAPVPQPLKLASVRTNPDNLPSISVSPARPRLTLVRADLCGGRVSLETEDGMTGDVCAGHRESVRCVSLYPAGGGEGSQEEPDLARLR